MIAKSTSMINPNLLKILLALFSCSVMYIITAESIAPLSISTDREALLLFKSRLTVQSPDPLSSWEANSPPCNWTGVSCNEYGQRIVGVDLSGLRLSGSISPHIGNLSFLRSIQFQNNLLTGMVPDQIGNLFQLRVLNLSSNMIQGAIPPNISQCRELRVLDLKLNEITGEIPQQIGQLTKLQVLNLGRNRLSGAIPSSISDISSLQVLSLGTNMLRGTIPSALGRLRLRVLDLIVNHLTGTVPPSIYNMSSLETFTLAANNLHGDVPYDIGVTLPNLRIIALCQNRFTGTIPGSLHNLKNIQIIRMSGDILHGSIPPGLGNLLELRRYDISHNNIVSSGNDGLSFLGSLANSTHLNFLVLESNFLEGIIPDSIGNLSGFLEYLHMSRNLISGNIPSSIGKLNGLGSQDLSHNFIFGEIPEDIGWLENLHILRLAGNHLSGKIPNSLSNLHQLDRFDLSENELVGTIPTSFGDLQNLLSLDLSSNKLNGNIPAEIFNLPRLSIFVNLSQNYLSGPLPQEVGDLQGVATINISHNRLSGNIPKAIGNCKSLEHLSFANNMFSGRIPDNLGAIRGLETLDLSSNKLSGEIPVNLQKLQALQLLNLSFNNFEGEIPLTGVFADPSKVHFEGNPYLCFHSGCTSNRSHTGRLLLLGIILVVILVCLIILGVGLLFRLRTRKKEFEERVEPLQHEHQMVTYDQLCLATENFNNQNLVGKGSFGSVYGGILDGVAVAVKVLDAGMTRSWKSFSAECAALRNVRHRNLVKLTTACSSIDSKNTEFLALVYEFMSNGSLEDWLKGKRTRNEKGLSVLERLNVVIDVACALDYLHHECEIPVVHCDIKPGNVLLNSEMTAKIGDFGLARLLIKSYGKQTSITSTNALKGSFGYIPPEYGLWEKPSTAGDVYSFGILLLEVFTGKSPTHEDFVGGHSLKNWVQMAFPTNIERVLDCNLYHGEQFINTEIPHDCLVNIIHVGLSCVSESPDGRISMTNALCLLKDVKDALLKPKFKCEPKH